MAEAPASASAPGFGGAKIPFVSLLGFELVRMEGGQSQLDWSPRPEHLNSFDVVHGGGLMTLLDVTMALAARSVEAAVGAVTIEMKTSFMRPARGRLGAHGTLLHRTATMAFCEARVVDAGGAVCAHAAGTFKFIRKLPVGAAAAQPFNPPTD